MKRGLIGVSIVAGLTSVSNVLAAESSSDPYFKYMAGIALLLLVIVFLINPKRKRREILQVESIEKETTKPIISELQKKQEIKKREEVRRIYDEESVYVLNPEGKNGYREQAVVVREEDI